MNIKDVFQNTNNKPDLDNFLSGLSGILDPQDLEVVVARGRSCDILFANAKAAMRMKSGLDEASICKTDYAKYFTGLCEHCFYNGRIKEADPESFEIEDIYGRTYIARSCAINWIDSKPATAFILRDITEDKRLKNRLYALAYTDQLTGVPNRQKLKEDFSAIGEVVESNDASGIIALFDLDFFKAVNDTYGHNTGDVILRRLTEHLQGESSFSGHLYRLGGDEFVLMYSGPAERFASNDDMKNYYNDILSDALRAYTLPNIDVKCTLSIGVSFFPKHGSSLSELLRKADIALYKAKAQGRNQIVFFEDKYDSAQKFKDIYISIQPVLLQGGKTFGYELVDRDIGGEEDEGTVSLNEFNNTVDALGLNDLENDLHYFISYSKQLLNPAVNKNLPKEKFVVQISVPARLSKNELQNDLRVCGELRHNGYKLALTGLSSSNPNVELLNYADYCKFALSDKNLNVQKRIIAANPGIKFIATNVDSQAAFLEARDAGFHLFQGFFFNQPVIGRKTKEISPLKMNYFRLLKLCSTGEFMDFREISAVISTDVALSYKILRILNSAAVGLRNVTSVASAVAYMGEENLKKWVAVLALRGIAEDKPLELVRTSLIRARFGELLAPLIYVKHSPQQAFMVGLLSLLHIALDKTNEELLQEIPVADEIRDSLLSKKGFYSGLLHFFENYEYANWEAVSEFVEENHLDASYVYDAYIKSVKWYNDLENV